MSIHTFLIKAVLFDSVNKANSVRIISVSFSAGKNTNNVTLTSLGIASSCELVGADASNPAK